MEEGAQGCSRQDNEGEVARGREQGARERRELRAIVFANGTRRGGGSVLVTLEEKRSDRGVVSHESVEIILRCARSQPLRTQGHGRARLTIAPVAASISPSTSVAVSDTASTGRET